MGRVVRGTNSPWDEQSGDESSGDESSGDESSGDEQSPNQHEAHAETRRPGLAVFYHKVDSSE